jgi:hypothetical protein
MRIIFLIDLNALQEIKYIKKQHIFLLTKNTYMNIT